MRNPTADAPATTGDYGFVVTATSGGIIGSVTGSLALHGPAALPTPEENSARADASVQVVNLGVPASQSPAPVTPTAALFNAS